MPDGLDHLSQPAPTRADAEEALRGRLAEVHQAATHPHTSTFTTLFDTDRVDELLGAAHSELESDYLRRKEHISDRDQRAIESRLAFLRACWTLMLDRSN